MRPEENIEKFVKDRKPRAMTSHEMDKQTLQDSFAVMEQTARSKSTKIGIPGVIIRSRVVRLAAAAAVIIVAVGLIFLRQDRQAPSGPETGPQPVAQSTVKKMSLMSMRTAFQKGGLDELDRQFRDTLNVSGPQLLNISMQELLEGVNGS